MAGQRYDRPQFAQYRGRSRYESRFCASAGWPELHDSECQRMHRGLRPAIGGVGRSARRSASDRRGLLLLGHRSTIMGFMTKKKAYAAFGLLVFALCLTLASRATAEEKVAKPQDVPASVIAHLALPEASGSQMLLQRENAKLYLYVQQVGKQGFMVVDVTRPEKPSLLKRTAESNKSTTGNLE